jgi:hypothetical protein
MRWTDDLLDRIERDHFDRRMLWGEIAQALTAELGYPVTAKSCRRALERRRPGNRRSVAAVVPSKQSDRHTAEGLRRALADETKGREIAEAVARIFQPLPSKIECRPMPPEVTAHGHHITPTLVVSDLHLDEVVTLSESCGFNEYNRAIAVDRLRSLGDRAVATIQRHLAADAVVDRVVVAMAGDILSGVIHDELLRTNEATIQRSLIFWAGQMADFLRKISAVWPIYVPCVVGNHGRDGKWHAKQRVDRSFDWLFYAFLASMVAGDDRISMDVAETTDIKYEVYGQRYLLCHGDDARGGNGIAGILSPLMTMDLRKRRMHGHDALIVGHFHTIVPDYHRVRANGSLVGYSGYAHSRGYAPEPPAQLMFFDCPERGTTLYAPIFVD